MVDRRAVHVRTGLSQLQGVPRRQNAEAERGRPDDGAQPHKRKRRHATPRMNP